MECYGPFLASAQTEYGCTSCLATFNDLRLLWQISTISPQLLNISHIMNMKLNWNTIIVPECIIWILEEYNNEPLKLIFCKAICCFYTSVRFEISFYWVSVIMQCIIRSSEGHIYHILGFLWLEWWLYLEINGTICYHCHCPWAKNIRGWQVQTYTFQISDMDSD